MHRPLAILSALLSVGFLSTCAATAPVDSKAKTMPEQTFRSSAGDLELKGTYATPSRSPRGIVLFLAGSGKVDRDETTPPEKTYSGSTEKLFSQLSEVLVANGFATFRYDKRGVLGPTGEVDPKIWETADRDNLISDAVAAAHFLMKKESIRADQLILLGHSEGTIIATEVAIQLGGKMRAMLLFGAQARSMKEMLHFQIVESRAKQGSGLGSPAGPEEEYRKALTMIETSSEMLAPDGKPMAWYRQHMAAPANAERLAQVQAKKFIFQGIGDPQTPIDELARFQRAGVKDLIIFQYPGLGHGFSPDRNGKPTLGPISSEVLGDLASASRSI